MKVLVLGFPRTGTQSIAASLLELGCTNVYHMREVGKNEHQKYWIAALEAKFEDKGSPFGREDFDKFLSDFDAVSDFPAAIFPEEFIKAYPEAKVVLSVRDEDAWYKSMMSTLIHAHMNIPRGGPSAMPSLRIKYHQHMWEDDFPANGLEAYRKHNAFVREISQGSEFLEYNVKDGWEPLCQFLGKQVPDRPFPRVDDWVAYKEAHSGKEEHS